MDKITLYQQALHTLGDREYKRDTPTGQECDLWYPTVLHEALNYGAWTFATRRRTLTPTAPGIYPLPADCLRPLKINHSSFELIGRDIHLNTAFHPMPDHGLELTYISSGIGMIEALPDDQPLFVRGIVLLLAARMAAKITGQPQLAIQLEQLATAALAEALHKDMLAANSNDQHPLDRILAASLLD